MRSASTASAHRALDEGLVHFDLTTTAHYCRFLQASAAALLPLEAALDQADMVLGVLSARGLVLQSAPRNGLAAADSSQRPGLIIATKTDQRTAQGGREDLHRSLDRLGVDHVDLWQLHNLADPIEWDTALSPGGVIEAAVEARQQGLIRGIGVTGHGLQIAATHRRSLERFDFDSVFE